LPALRRHYWQANRLRSGLHVAGSVRCAPITILRQYIEQQDHRAWPSRPTTTIRLHHRPAGRRI